MNPATTQSQLRTRIQLGAAFLAVITLWFVLCRQLSGEWSVNEQYSYGWLVPLFAAVLFWLRWEDRPKAGRRKAEDGRRNGASGASDIDRNAARAAGSEAGAERINFGIAVAVLALAVLFPVRLVEVANPDWRPLDWIHAAAVVTLTLVGIWAAGGWPWVRHFAFPVCFIFVAVPWITPIEEPIVQGLMRTVAALATETITLFGVPAQVEGNLIRVSTGLVGVSEACSGVRSLQTSLMIGLLFGELKRFSISKRCLLLAGAILLALLANFGRALFLIWKAATESVSAVDRWHDLAGYAIVAIVFLGSLLLAKILDRDAKVESRKAKVENGDGRPALDFRARIFLLPTFYFLLPRAS